MLEYFSDTDHHDLADPLTGVPLVALYVGTAVYLLGQIAFRYRNIGTWNPHRSLAAVVLAMLIPLAWQLPALAALALLGAVLAGLVGYEMLRFAENRDHARRVPERGQNWWSRYSPQCSQ